MKSKTLSFDKTIFFKNIRRFWPVWAGYMFFLFWTVVAVDYFSLAWTYWSYDEPRGIRIVRMILGDNMGMGLGASVVFPIIAAMCVFSYLCSEKSTNFIHSLPITRLSLFLTNYVSGLTMLLVPNIITALLSLWVSAGKGYAAVKEIFLALLIISVCDLFMFSLGTLCAVFTGQIVMIPLLFYIALIYFPVMQYPLNFIYEQMFVGIYSAVFEIPGNGFWSILSPVEYIFKTSPDILVVNDQFSYTLSNTGEHLLTLFILSLVLIVCSALLYKIRRSEASGDTIVYKYAKPVFRCGFGFSFGLMFTALFIVTLFDRWNGTFVLRIITIILMVITSVVCYLIAEMIMRKSFRVFKPLKQRLPIFAGCLTVIAIVLTMDITGAVSYVPDTEDVAKVTMITEGHRMHYFDAEHIDDIRDIHQTILSEKDLLDSRNYYEYSCWVYLTYYMTDGKQVERHYYVPETAINSTKIIEQFAADNALYYYLGMAPVDMLVEATMQFEVEDHLFETITLTRDESIKLYNAVKADVNAGYIDLESANYPIKNIAYDYIDRQDYDPYGYFEGDRNLRYSGDPYKVYFRFEYGEYSSWDNLNIYYNKDCINTLNFISRYIK